MKTDAIDSGNHLIDVEVAYALPEKQVIAKVAVPIGTTAAQAIELSNIRQLFPGIEEQPLVGIFSRKVALDYPLQSGDRVEIYRALMADPKEVRRKRAEEQKAKAKEELNKLRQH
ncbi:MAG: RnfH family protein [Xanthomonadales bacterium]|nr:RnfH family protein [Xanthomonadales bacterium]